MPTVKIIGKYKIQVYADDHHPPHCHIISSEFEILVDLRDLSILKGGRYRRQITEVMDWIRENQQLLKDEWARQNEH